MFLRQYLCTLVLRYVCTSLVSVDLQSAAFEVNEMIKQMIAWVLLVISRRFLLLYLSTYLPFLFSTFLLIFLSTFLHFYLYSFILFHLSTYLHFSFSTFLLFIFSSFPLCLYSSFILFLLTSFPLQYFSTFTQKEKRGKG